MFRPGLATRLSSSAEGAHAADARSCAAGHVGSRDALGGMDADHGIGLAGARATAQVSLPLGAADDEQQLQIDTPSADHRAPSMAPPPAAWVTVLDPRCRDGLRNPGTARGRPKDGRSRGGRHSAGGGSRSIGGLHAQGLSVSRLPRQRPCVVLRMHCVVLVNGSIPDHQHGSRQARHDDYVSRPTLSSMRGGKTSSTSPDAGVEPTSVRPP